MIMSLEALILYVMLSVLFLSMTFAFIRLVRGPHLADRVISLDIMGILGLGIVTIYAIATDTPALLDVASILALIAFLGTVAFAYFLQRRVT